MMPRAARRRFAMSIPPRAVRSSTGAARGRAAQTPDEGGTMPRYAALLYDKVDALAGWSEMSPEEIQQVIEKYLAWGERLAAEGKLAGGDKLRDGEGRVLRGTGADARVIDGPFSETREVIGGIYTLIADSYDEAIAIAQTCPHLEFGGMIELREIEVLAPDSAAA
jgi:hypothetical protein